MGREESSKTANSPLVEMIPKDTTEEQREIERTIMVTAKHQSRQLQGTRKYKIRNHEIPILYNLDKGRLF